MTSADLTKWISNLDRWRSELLAIKYELKFRQFIRALKTFTPGDQFNAQQLRDWHGRWTAEGRTMEDSDQNFDLAQLEMGNLLGRAIIHPSRGGGVDCFYKFSYGIVAIPGPNSGSCWSSIPWFGATHGRLIKGAQ